MKKMINRSTISGYLFDHSLVVKTVERQDSENYGMSFIRGRLNLVVDEKGLNVVTIEYDWVPEIWKKKNSKNVNFDELKKIIDSGVTWTQAGKDATKIQCERVKLDVNDFVNKEGELISAQRLSGGWVSIVQEFGPSRNDIEVDMLMTQATRVEANPDRETEEYMRLKGCTFDDFNERIYPCEFIVKGEGMDFFESLEISAKNPYFTKVFATMNNITTRIEKVEESAFGPDIVTSYDKKTKEWLLVKVPKVPYDYGDENVLTKEDVNKAIEDRELYLAGVRKNNEDWKARQGKATQAPPKTEDIAHDNFDFF